MSGNIQVSGPAGPAGIRVPGSIRRTTTIDTTWTGDWLGPMTLHGIGRDMVTPAAGSEPQVLALDDLRVTMTQQREILSIAASPLRPAIGQLIGTSAGSRLRAMIGDALPQEMEKGTPLYLLLDDLAGASLVAISAWQAWDPDWLEGAQKLHQATSKRQLAGICVGFAPGSNAILPNGQSNPSQNRMIVPQLDAGGDPLAWHRLDSLEGPSARRARLIDVTIADDIEITTHFQDTTTLPDGERLAVHEYIVRAKADPETLELTEIAADPRILPYAECPSAILNVDRMVGTRLSDLRMRVIQQLHHTAGCTHLNDTLRSLAEVPQLVAKLGAAEIASYPADTPS